MASAQMRDASIEYGIVFRAQSSGLSGGGACFFDYNNDGWQDIFICGGELEDRLYTSTAGQDYRDDSHLVNRGTLIRNTAAVTSADLDGDGCEDLIVGTFKNSQASYILAGDCEGGFRQITLPPGIDGFGETSGIIITDLNEDQLLDILLLNYILFPDFVRDATGDIIGYAHECQQNIAYLNLGNFRFIESTRSLSLGGVGCTYAGMELVTDDGSSSIYSVNDFGEWVWPNEYFTKDDSGQFLEQAAMVGLDLELYGMGVAAADVDGDLDIDLYVTNIGSNQLLLLDDSTYQDRAHHFDVLSDTTPRGWNSTSWGAVFIDIDNDSDQDLFVANGFINVPNFLRNDILDPDKLYRNDGGAFTDISVSYGMADPGIHRAAIKADVNHDGKEDLFVTQIDGFVDAQSPERNANLWINEELTGNYVKLHLGDSPFTRPKSAVLIDIHIDDNHTRHIHYAGGSHASSSSPVAHIGLGDASKVDSIVVRYSTGQIRRAWNVAADVTLWLAPDRSVHVVGCTDSKDPAYVSQATIHGYCLSELSTSNHDVSLPQACNDFISLSELKLLRSLAPRSVSSIHDILGRRLSSIDLESLVPGHYYVHVREGHRTCLKSLVISRQ